MDNPHFQRSILSSLKNLDLAAIRLQADQVDERVAGLVVEGKCSGDAVSVHVLPLDPWSGVDHVSWDEAISN